MRDEQTSGHRLVTVIVPCCGQAEHTRLSVPRLLRHSRSPCEFVFVDVASLDGTGDFLAGVAAVTDRRAEVVRAEAEEDFGRAIEEAIGLAEGALIAWVNNDVLVPALWLDQLVALASAHDVIGMVGPMANLAPAAQQVDSIPYRLRERAGLSRAGVGPRPLLDTSPYDKFAAEFREAHQGQWSEVAVLGGFCLLLKRECVDLRRFFTETAGSGTFDADRLSATVRSNGYRLAACRDLVVHHFGGYISS